MLVLLPVILLLIAALAILIWQAVRPGFGAAWLIAAGAALAEWGLLLFLHFRLPLQFLLKQWRPLGESSDFPYFTLDPVSWMYAFCLAGLVVAVVLTASARLIYKTNPRSWAGDLAIAGVAMLAIFSANPLTLAVSWMAVDVVELVVMLATVREGARSRQVVVAFAARVVGTVVLIWAILLGRSRGVVLSFAQVPPEIGGYLLLAAGLRLGVLPLHLPYVEEIPMRRGQGTLLRVAAPASSLMLLARLPANPVPAQWMPYLLAFTALAVLYCAFMWLFSSDELNGRPYWLIALAGLAVACVARGQPVASLAWGSVLLLPGGLLFLYSARQRSVQFLPVLGFIGLAGLPFTPAAAGWGGLWSLPFNGLDLLFVIALAALLAGYLKHGFQTGDRLDQMDRWVQGVYPFGLLVLVITQWVSAYLALRGSFALGVAWVAGLSTLLALGGLGLYARTPAVALEGAPAGWLGVIGGRVGRVLAVVFRLDWLYGLFSRLYGTFRRLINMLTTILEGDAGVLWALVLLALLISLLRTGGQP